MTTSTDSKNHRRIHTRFAGGINLWSQNRMTANEISSRTTASRKGSVFVDIAKLQIETAIPLPKKRNVPNKYEGVFSNLKPKGSIKCGAEQVGSIASALRKFINEKGLDATMTIVTQKHCDDDSKYGRVWMWPKSESGAIANSNKPNSLRGRKAA